ncbi:MAG: hypothetical protein ABIW76_21360 [Fibrobacteria bacterium]
MRTHSRPPTLRARTPGTAASANAAVAAIAFALFTFSGCINDERSAGVDEFPNSIYARVHTFLDEGKKSESISAAASVPDTLLGGSGFHVGAGKVAGAKIAAAAKAGAEAPFLRGLAKAMSAGAAGVDSGCTAGVITVTDTSKAPLKITVNIASVCFDAKALDSIKGNEIIIRGKTTVTFNTGRVETAELSDADGDGILNPKGTGAKANLLFTALEKGILEKTVLVVGPGPDASFDTEKDNLVYSADWTKTSGSDTLGYAHYTDADSDGVAIDNGKASVVDLAYYQKGPSKDHPDAVWSKADLRMVVRYQVEAKEVRRVRFEMEGQAGRRQLAEIVNDLGGADIDMRERVHAHFYTFGAGGSDSLDTMYVHLSMSLGADFDSKADDSVYAIDVRTRKRSGDERLAKFSFLSAKAIPSGKDPETGTLSMDVEYGNGETLTVEGEISPATMDVTVKDRADKRQHVVWDREGRGISMEELKK